MDGPIHRWFGLSYDGYVVISRTVLQSMPEEFQARFIAMFGEMEAALGHHAGPGSYVVTMEDERGNVVEDPLADYQRGRRRLEPRPRQEG